MLDSFVIEIVLSFVAVGCGAIAVLFSRMTSSNSSLGAQSTAPVGVISSAEVQIKDLNLEESPKVATVDPAQTDLISAFVMNATYGDKSISTPENVSPPSAPEPLVENHTAVIETPQLPIVEEIVVQKPAEQPPVESSMIFPTDTSALANVATSPIPSRAHDIAQHGNSSFAYCVKCKSKKQIRDPLSVTMKNGRPAIRGYCLDCGTKVFRIGSSN